MTNKEFFLEVLKDEEERFKKIITAVPEAKYTYQVHEHARTAGSLVAQLALQWVAISEIVMTGTPSFDMHALEGKTQAELLEIFEHDYPALEADVEKITDEDWLSGKAGFGIEKNTTKYKLAWGFLFDAIHHRGQLTTYLRSMNEKVPAIYGPSFDEKL